MDREPGLTDRQRFAHFCLRLRLRLPADVPTDHDYGGRGPETISFGEDDGASPVVVLSYDDEGDGGYLIGGYANGINSDVYEPTTPLVRVTCDRHPSDRSAIKTLATIMVVLAKEIQVKGV